LDEAKLVAVKIERLFEVADSNHRMHVPHVPTSISGAFPSAAQHAAQQATTLLKRPLLLLDERSE
jgi:hypothetical protein